MNPDESVVQLRAYASNLEDVITQRDAELTATNHQLESLVYSIAHDLRAPLRAMQGYSAMLIEESSLGLNAAGADYAQRIGKAALHMDSLLSDLLRGGQAVEDRHLDVKDDQIGTLADRELDRRLTVTRLADDLVVLFLEHLLEVEPDQRLVFGDHDTSGTFAHPTSLP